MTYDRRPADPVDPDYPADDGTRVVERQTYVEHDRTADRGYVPPAAAAPQTNVNVDGTDRGYARTASPGPLYYARRVLSLLFGILAVLIGLRILLLLLVANEGNAIVDFVLSVTEPFVAPFRGIFSFDVVQAGQSQLDLGAVVALIGWLLIYLLIMAILRLGDRDRV
jgi:uncharacterized protein YggT (Ycf19 family)